MLLTNNYTLGQHNKKIIYQDPWHRLAILNEKVIATSLQQLLFTIKPLSNEEPISVCTMTSESTTHSATQSPLVTSDDVDQYGRLGLLLDYCVQHNLLDISLTYCSVLQRSSLDLQRLTSVLQPYYPIYHCFCFRQCDLSESADPNRFLQDIITPQHSSLQPEHTTAANSLQHQNITDRNTLPQTLSPNIGSDLLKDTAYVQKSETLTVHQAWNKQLPDPALYRIYTLPYFTKLVQNRQVLALRSRNYQNQQKFGEGELCGVVVYSISGSSFHIEALFKMPDTTEKQVLFKLIQLSKLKARSLNCSKLILYHAQEIEALGKLYTQAGFTWDETLNRHYFMPDKI